MVIGNYDHYVPVPAVVKLDGKDVNIPRALISNEVFGVKTYYFSKPIWLSDDSSPDCMQCQAPFSQIRRRHHCRMCGKIFCGKCTNEKIPLPQLGLNEPQRVCDGCCNVSKLVAKSRADSKIELQGAASGLSEMIKTEEEMRTLLSGGGLHSLITLTSQNEPEIMELTTSAIHSLSQHLPLHSILIEVGTIKAVAHILGVTSSGHQKILDSCIGILLMLCKPTDAKLKIIEAGVISKCLHILEDSSSTACSLIMQLLVQLTLHIDLILSSEMQFVSIIPQLLPMLNQNDDLLKEMSSKILARLSAASENCRLKIIEIEEGNGFSIASCPEKIEKIKSSQILSNFLCLIGNIACSEFFQEADAYTETLLQLMRNQSFNELLLVNTMRCLANISEKANSCHLILPHLSIIISKMLKYEDEILHCHGCRLVTNCIKFYPEGTFSALSDEGALVILKTVFSFPDTLSLVNKKILNKSSKLTMPPSI